MKCPSPATSTASTFSGSIIARGTARIKRDCKALYQVVKAEAAPETSDRAQACRACGASFPSREGVFVLTYFLLRHAGRIRTRTRQDGSFITRKTNPRPRLSRREQLANEIAPACRPERRGKVTGWDELGDRRVWCRHRNTYTTSEPFWTAKTERRTRTAQKLSFARPPARDRTRV
jgi:hypothetical protein